jgi:hypothetical protein
MRLTKEILIELIKEEIQTEVFGIGSSKKQDQVGERSWTAEFSDNAGQKFQVPFAAKDQKQAEALANAYKDMTNQMMDKEEPPRPQPHRITVRSLHDPEGNKI